MKTANIVKTICAVGLSATCALSLVACANSNTSTSSSEGYTGGVAATVNGTEIAEDTITSQVQAIRTQMGVDTEDAWGQWLVQYSYTPETVREEIINSYVQQELIRLGAAEKGLTADSAEIDTYVDSIKSQYESDEAWQAALEGANTTEEEYRKSLELSILSNDLYASFATTEEPSEEDLLSYSQMYATTYDGAKRSSHILFAADDEATAQSVLDQINAGTLSFEDAVAQYSTDTASAAKNGDVGWDKLSSLDSDYQAGLDALEKDQVSGLTTSSFGIHIIKCTDVFTAPAEVTSTDQIPTEFLEKIKTMISSSKQSEAYQAWLAEYKETVDIVINDMPEGLPYYVDMTKYQTADSSTDSTTTDGTTTGDSTTDGTADSSDASDAATGDAATTADDSADSSTDAASKQPAEAA